MSYKPISEDQTLEIAEDDGELDVVVKREKKATRKQLPLLIWVILVTIIGGLIIYIGYSNAQQGGTIKKVNKQGNYTKINKTTYFEKTAKEDDQDQPKLVEIKEEQDETVKMEEIQENQEDLNIEVEEDKNEEESNVDFEEMQKESERLKEEIKNYNEHKNETKIESIDKRFDKQLCDQGQYMNHVDKKCKNCDDHCDECMHISGICYKCQNEYYLNQYGKCIPKCEGYHDYNNLLLSEENKNQSIPICFGKNFTSQIYMTVQKSNNTHFVLPYIIIHPATSVTLLYHNNYPIVYYFNKDLFNFEEDLKLTDIIQQAEKRQQIVIVLGCHSLYDFSLFNNFLFQPAMINIETLVKARSTTFRAFFGQDYNAYGVIREYQAQYKNNTIDLVISDDPIEISHEYLEYNLLITHEQHYTDYNFESLQGAQSEKTTVILLFHTKNENDQHDYCQRFKYVSFLQCAIREIHIDHIQRMKQGLELISQFVAQPDL